MFNDLLNKILSSKLTIEEQVNLTSLLLLQTACSGMIGEKSDERTHAFVTQNNLRDVWEQSYVPKHKFLAATGNKPVVPSDGDIVSFLATYLDYDVEAAIRGAV